MNIGIHSFRRYGDEMQCHKCGRSWGVNDPEPPKCTKRDDKQAREVQHTVNRYKQAKGL